MASTSQPARTCEEPTPAASYSPLLSVDSAPTSSIHSTSRPTVAQNRWLTSRNARRGSPRPRSNTTTPYSVAFTVSSTYRPGSTHSTSPTRVSRPNTIDQPTTPPSRASPNRSARQTGAGSPAACRVASQSPPATPARLNATTTSPASTIMATSSAFAQPLVWPVPLS